MFSAIRIIPVVMILCSSVFAQSTYFEENFEGTTPNMTITGGGWEYGTPSNPSTVPEGNRCAGTVLNGNYSNSAQYLLTSPSINLPDSTVIKFSFYEWYQLESCCDYIYLEIEKDNSGTWTSLRTSANGQNTTWNSRSYDISTYRNSSIKIRFRLTSDGSVVRQGWYIDNVLVFTPETKTLDVTNDGNGTTTPSGSTSIETNSPYSILASPNTGYRFDKWTVESGNATINDTLAYSTNVSITNDAVIKANFKPCTVYTITSTATRYNYTTHYYQNNPSSGVRFKFTAPAAGAYSVLIQNIQSHTNYFYFYGNDPTFSSIIDSRGSSITEKSISFYAANPGDVFYFRVYTSSSSYYSNDFNISYSNALAINITNDGNGITNPAGMVGLTSGESRSITALPNSGYRFGNWSVISGSAVISDTNATNTTISITSDATIQANFTSGTVYDLDSIPTVYNFDLNYFEISPSNGVRFRFSAPDSGTYTIVIDSSYKHMYYYSTDSTFSSYSGTVTYNDSVILYSFTASSAGECHYFIVRPYSQTYYNSNFYASVCTPSTLIITTNGNGIVLPHADTMEVYPGYPYTFTAVPKGGYQFSSWNLISGQATFSKADSSVTTVIMSGDTAVIEASFQIDPNTVPYVNISDINISSHPDICITASVKDSSGRSISGLDSSNFVLTQDSDTVDFQLTTVSNFGGVSVALVIDRSGSMSGQRIIDAKNAAKQYIKTMTPLDRCAIVSFNSSVTVDQPITSDTILLNAAINGISATGGTAIKDGTYSGVSQLINETNARNVIVFSDGSDGGNNYTINEVINHARSNNVTIYSIGIGGAGQTVLGPLADSTGGYYSYAPTAAGLAQLYAQIKSDIESQYILCYQSPDIIFNGDTHEVVLSVNLNSFTDNDTVYWDENNSPPSITLTTETRAMIGVSQTANQPLTISANVIDDGIVNSVRLFYRISSISNSAYTEIPMSLSSGTLYEIDIPSANVVFPGIDFYILASDNYNLIGRSPNVMTPEQQPYVIPVENEAPRINHTAFDCVTIGRDTSISAVITDNNGLYSTILYHKKGNETFFIADTMTKTGQDLFSSTIQGNRITNTGIDYYIRAIDSAGAATRFPENGYISLPMCNSGLVILVPPDTSMHEGEIISFVINAYVQDGTIPDLKINNPPSMCTFSDSGNGNALLTIAPGCIDNGVYTISLAAINGTDTVTSDFQITVHDVNFPPVIDSIGNQISRKGEPFSLTVNVFDCDLTTPSINLLRPPSGSSFIDNNDRTGTFTWTPDSSEYGYYVLIFEASDGNSTVRDTVILEITDENIYEPVLTLSDTIIHTSLNLPVTILITSEDGDGTLPVLKASKLPENATFASDNNGTALLSWTPTDTGNFSFDITAIDFFDTTNMVSVTVTIFVGNGNITGPVFLPRPDTTVFQNSEMRLLVEAHDQDGTIPELFFVSGPNGIDFQDNGDGTGKIIWIPQCDESGNFTVKIGARDESLADTVSVVITVIKVNCPPVINHTPDVNADPGQMITIPVSAYDPDNDGTIPLLSASCDLEGFVFITSNNGTGEFRCPVPADSGIYSVTFYATDGVSTDSIKVKIAVNKHGSISIKGNVKGSQIYALPSGTFSGNYLGTDSVKTTLPQGAYWFEIRARGYRAQRIFCKIEADKTVKHSVNLKKSIPLMLTGPDTLSFSADSIATPRAFSFIDLNMDGIEDLVVLSNDGFCWYAGQDSLHNTKYRKQMSDQFKAIAGYNPVCHQFIDWDNDGIYDHLFSDPSGKIMVVNGKDLSVSTLISRNSGEMLYSVIIDTDNKGNKDLLVHSQGRGLYLYNNNGTTAKPVYDFAQECTDSSGNSFTDFKGTPLLIDLDNDGALEFIINSGNKVSVYTPDTVFSTLVFREHLNCAGNRFNSDSSFISLTGSPSGLPKIAINRNNTILLYPTHLLGDINFDNVVNIKDISIISKQMEYNKDDQGYNPILNLMLSKDGNEVIDIRDISKASKCWELQQ
ncbi:MAG: VWA domain-containing protein [Fibrobacter sp.]|nr:VWA domain-containing protein [Fibrobacter sp.]